MNGILAWFARNSVAANLLMWLILAGGLLSVSAIRTQVIPDLSYELITVSVPYPGASPGEVDEAVCARVDDSLQGLETVRRVHSVATQGLCYARVYLLHGVEISESLDDVKARIDAIDSFPEDVEQPVVEELDPPSQVLSLVISGQTDERTLVHLGEKMREEVAALPGVTLVKLSGVRPFEISIEVSEEALRRYDLTLSQVAEAVRRSSLDLPGGSVKTRGAEILLRSQGQAYTREEFEVLVLLSRGDGTRLTVGEVASVSDGFAETVEVLHFDGESAVKIDVFRVGDQNVQAVVDRINGYLDQARPRLPGGIQVTLWRDQTIAFRDRLGTLLANGRDGLVLVLVVLALFLSLRLSTWVALGIPISFLGTLWWMVANDHSINVISLVGFIVVLGIVVDDAVVIGENIYRHLQEGKEGLEAATDGVREVAGPVFFSVVTTIVAFAPLLSLPGTAGQLIRVVPIVVIVTLVFSLAESFLILPAHLAHLSRADSPGNSGAGGRSRFSWERGPALVSSLLDRLVVRVYRPALEQALAWRSTTLATALAIFLVSVGLVAGGRVRFSFFPPVGSSYLVVGLTLPQGTPEEVTARALRHIERQAEELRRELAATDESDGLRHVLTMIGSLPASGRQFSDPGRLEAKGPHLGGVTIEMAPGSERTVSAEDLGRRLRQLIGAIPDAVELSFSTSVVAAGKAVAVDLAAADLDALRLAATKLKTALSSYPAVFGIGDSLRAGKREVRLSVTPEGEALGVSLAELSRQVRQAFHGEEAQRLQRGRHELKVMVRYPDNERRLLSNLENMRIRTSRGDEVPFAVAGQIAFGRGFSAIERADGRWTVRVSADVDGTRGESHEILQDLQQSVLPELIEDHPGLSYALAGEQQEQRETLGALRRNTLLALFLIYALLAVAAGSYLQPLIVMGAIPFGIVGAIWGHLIMGFPLTMWSLLGMVALAGVVVNDSLVLVDFVNRARRAGTPLAEAIRWAGEARFKPIVLTSLTTFAGLAPLLFEKSVQAQFLIPIAIALAFGSLFATLVTLVLVPVSYSLVRSPEPVPFERQGTQPKVPGASARGGVFASPEAAAERSDS